jgi:hypothetical protein
MPVMISEKLDSFDWPVVGVVPFSKAECPSSPVSGPPLFSWREFYGLRNALLTVLEKHGTAGPMGELPILETWELSEDAATVNSI